MKAHRSPGFLPGDPIAKVKSPAQQARQRAFQATFAHFTGISDAQVRATVVKA